MWKCDCPPENCAGMVAGYLEGQREAGDALARKFAPLITRIVQRVLGVARRAEWEDACQALFLHLFASLDRWEGRCPFCRWLAVVSARRAIDFSRLADANHGWMCHSQDDVPDTRSVAHSETVACLREAVERFPEEWRQVFHLWLQGQTPDAIAGQLQKSARTIHYWLAAIRDRLTDCLPD